MQALLKKVLSLAVPAMVATAAFLHAQAIGALVDATATPKSIAPFAEARAAESPAVVATRSAEPILARNIFDHTARPRAAEPSTSARPDILVANAPPCEGVRTIVTVAAATPDGSFAALDVGGKRKFGRRGSTVEGFDVVYVGADRVWMRQGEAICQSLVFAEPPPAKAKAAPGSATSSPLEQQIGKQIEKTGPTSYAIDRGAVSRILEAQAELIKTPVAPEQENGRVVGYRLVRIKPGSVLAMLGLESGDRLEAINGTSVATTEGMMEVYARLGTLDRMSIQLTRGGRPLTLDYAVK